MRTIRKNTFETNSSSCHCVTILSDEEYKSIKDCTGLINSGSYHEINESEIIKALDGDINCYKENERANKEEVAILVKLLKKDFSKWTDDEKNKFLLSKTSPEDIYRTAAEKRLEKCNSNIDAYRKKYRLYQTFDKAQVVNLVKDLVPRLDEVKNHFCYDDFYNKDVVSEDVFDWVVSYLSDFDNIETYGSHYEECHEDKRTLGDITVHVLSYSGYDG